MTTNAADVILLNGRIVTVTAPAHVAEAVAVVAGRITAVGDSPAIRQRADANTRVIDLQGRTVTPGLVDSHAHLATLAVRDLFQIDLSYPGTKSIADIVAKVRAAASRTPAGQWIQASGWVESGLAENRYPTRADLDPVTPAHPVILTHSTGHFAVANSIALRHAGITRDSPEPARGSIVRDPATGEPTGMLKELPAMEQVSRHIPPRSADDWDRAVAHGTERWLAEGVTAIKDNYARAEYIQIVAAYQRLAAKRQLRFRPYLMCRAESPEDVAFVSENSPGTWTLAHNGFPKLGGVKLFMDGSLVARTAWMNEPYQNSADCGYPAMAPDEITRIVKAADARGLQVGIHAIGDRAVDAVLDAYEATEPRAAAKRRFSVMHALLATPTAVRRMRQMDVVIETQSAFMPSLAVGYTRAIEPMRLRRLLPLRTLIRAGLTVANGSDSPTTPPMPGYGMWAACTRPAEIDEIGESPYGLDERISAFDALRMYTTMGARSLELEEYIGSVEPGKFADLVVWDRNLLAIPATELRDARPVTTIVGGEIVFQAP